MARAGTWALGLGVSAVVHVAFGAALMAALQPQEIPNQPRAESKLTVTPEVVTRSEAVPQTPESADVTGEDPSGSTMGAGAVTTSTAQLQPLPQAQAAPQQKTEVAAVQPLAPNPVASQVAAPQTSAAVVPSGNVQPASLPQSAATTGEQPIATAAASVTPDALAAKAPTSPPPPRVASIAPQSTQAFSTAPEAPVLTAAVPQPSLAQPMSPTSSMTAAMAPKPQTSDASAPPATTASAQPPNPMVSGALQPIAQTTNPQAPSAPTTNSQSPVATNTDPTAPTATAANAKAPTSNAVGAGTPDVTATKAVLAFPDADSGPIDPASLAAFQSFTQPSQDNDPMRDSLQSLLALPCARMQVSFDPDTASLQLTGHVPDASLRGPILDALRAQMGGNIAVTDNLLILPAPQCGALSGIAAVGLPQSTDQITNPLIVGSDTHALSFRYIKDDPLVLDLVAPDYPAYVYVDYFDADGNVIHLSPNAQAPLVETTPKQQLQIGARTSDEPGLFVIIGPPYGQEIAVAFAASVPLYTEARPLVEPAAQYLEWLQGQITLARATDENFKGEWVYFFVQTAPE